MEKMYISDFPLKVKPCKYWWVRYTDACTYVDKKVEEILWDLIHKFYPNQKCNGIISEFVEVPVDKVTKYDVGRMRDEDFKDMLTKKSVKVQKHFLHKKGGNKEIKNPLILTLLDYRYKGTLWSDCPFQNKDQSKCPFYKEDEWYKDVSLEELRKPNLNGEIK